MRPILGPALLCTLLAGCGAGPTPATAPAPGVPLLGADGMPRVTRSGAQCAEVIDRVRAHPDSFPYSTPMLQMFPAPIGGAPADLRGKLVHVTFLVDHRGTPVADSTTFDPEVTDQRYAATLRGYFARYRFRPGVAEGCAVGGTARVDYTIQG